MKKIGWAALIMITVATLIAGFASPTGRHENLFWWSRIPGFYILFGLGGGVLLSAVAKLLGILILQKKEDYYDER